MFRVSDLNVGRVVLGDQKDGFASPGAGAVLEMLARHGVYLFVYAFRNMLLHFHSKGEMFHKHC